MHDFIRSSTNKTTENLRFLIDRRKILAPANFGTSNNRVFFRKFFPKYYSFKTEKETIYAMLISAKINMKQKN